MTHSWYRIILNRDDILKGKHSQLQKDFDTVFMAMLAPTHMAMFGGRDLNAQQQPYDFAIPAGSEIFTQLFLTNNSAQPFQQPARSDCSLLVGSADAWNLLK